LSGERLRIAAKPLGISKVDASSEAIQIQFIPNPPIDPMKVITLIQSMQPPDTVGRSPLVREGGQTVAPANGWLRQ